MNQSLIAFSLIFLSSFNSSYALDSSITSGQVTFKNSCDVSLSLNNVSGNFQKLASGASFSKSINSFNQAQANVVFPYPNLANASCPSCDGWTALGGAPGTIQRDGAMWEGSNLKYAAYCNPNLSGRSICAAQKNCCGTGMIQDGTFGTHFEFTPNANGLDFVNLSTNYGSSPTTPPTLCGSTGANPNDCVSKAANIFYNVPIKWSTNQNCDFTSKNTVVTGLECTSVDCPDAYQHPTDDKQASCPSANASRGYLVEYCPDGHKLP